MGVTCVGEISFNKKKINVNKKDNLNCQGNYYMAISTMYNRINAENKAVSWSKQVIDSSLASIFFDYV